MLSLKYVAFFIPLMLPSYLLLAAASTVTSASFLNSTSFAISNISSNANPLYSTQRQQWIEGWVSNFANLDPALATSCALSGWSSFQQFDSTDTKYIWTTITNTLTESSTTVTFPETLHTNDQITWTSPCCYACSVLPEVAHLIYWPTPNPNPAVTTIIGTDGYTL